MRQPIKVPRSSEELFTLMQQSRFTSVVNYIVNSKYRKAVRLKSWIKDQVDNPSQELQTLADTFKDGYVDYDRQMRGILRWVQRNIRYTGDSTVWKMTEYWQTAEETFIKRTGDCEDGAILIYVLGRLAGVPASRMELLAGSVFDPFTKKTAGHCWLAYHPMYYPADFVFLDWCYYYDYRSIGTRDKFTIVDKTIGQFKHKDALSVYKVDSNYYNIWFGFNESLEYSKYKSTWA